MIRVQMADADEEQIVEARLPPTSGPPEPRTWTETPVGGHTSADTCDDDRKKRGRQYSAVLTII
jgi:hypothetical protein